MTVERLLSGGGGDAAAEMRRLRGSSAVALRRPTGEVRDASYGKIKAQATALVEAAVAV